MQSPKYGFDKIIPLLKVVNLGKSVLTPPFYKLKTKITKYYED